MPDAGSGGGGGTGAGYNIPISVSYARSEAINPVFGAPTYFNFSSPFSDFGGQSSQSSQTPVATATSAAAQHDAGASSSTPVVAGGITPGGSGSATSFHFTWQTALIAGLAVVATVVIYKYAKR